MQMTDFKLICVSPNKLDEDDHFKGTSQIKTYRKLLHTTRM